VCSSDLGTWQMMMMNNLVMSLQIARDKADDDDELSNYESADSR